MILSLICLANSRKLGGRCVAGISPDGRQWIRPVTHSPSGTLSRRDYTLENGNEVELLDLVEIDVVEARPEPHQPENWVLEVTPWKFIERLNPAQALPLLTQIVRTHAELLGNRSDRVNYEALEENPSSASLALIEPTGVLWVITDNIRGNRQTRVRFRLGNQQYDLVVTDPKWRERLSHLDWGTHTREAAGIGHRDRVFFTVSLGEPFNGECYKLVAAVIVVPN